jgi:hypothetical protein
MIVARRTEVAANKSNATLIEIQHTWFSLLSFHQWVDEAFILLCSDLDEDERLEIAFFLAFFRHPLDNSARSLDVDRLVMISSSIYNCCSQGECPVLLSLQPAGLESHEMVPFILASLSLRLLNPLDVPRNFDPIKTFEDLIKTISEETSTSILEIVLFLEKTVFKWATAQETISNNVNIGDLIRIALVRIVELWERIENQNALALPDIQSRLQALLITLSPS